MEYIAENAGHVPVPELVQGALLEMADNEEREWEDKINAFHAEVTKLEQYKLTAYTPDELEDMEASEGNDWHDWNEEHREMVNRLLARATSMGIVAPHVICKCQGCERRFRKSLQSAEDRSPARRLHVQWPRRCASTFT
jgi:hypothetical protein